MAIDYSGKIKTLAPKKTDGSQQVTYPRTVTDAVMDTAKKKLQSAINADVSDKLDELDRAVGIAEEAKAIAEQANSKGRIFATVALASQSIKNPKVGDWCAIGSGDDDLIIYRWNEEAWESTGKVFGEGGDTTTENVSDSATGKTQLQINTEVNTALGTKVDKVAGKGLIDEGVAQVMTTDEIGGQVVLDQSLIVQGQLLVGEGIVMAGDIESMDGKHLSTNDYTDADKATVQNMKNFVPSSSEVDAVAFASKFFMSELVLSEQTGKVYGTATAIAAAHSAQAQGKTLMIRCADGSCNIVTSPCTNGSEVIFSFEHNCKLYRCQISTGDVLTTTCVEIYTPKYLECGTQIDEEAFKTMYNGAEVNVSTIKQLMLDGKLTHLKWANDTGVFILPLTLQENSGGTNINALRLWIVAGSLVHEVYRVEDSGLGCAAISRYDY